ncbi:Protein T08G11.2 [Aphelenchoides avenae]|nr:Protein T08G11.2 [Aphelenchus avenae]
MSSARHSRKDRYEQRSGSRLADGGSSRRNYGRSQEDERSSRSDDEAFVCCIHGVPCELNKEEEYDRNKKPERDAGEEDEVGNGYEPIALLPKVRVMRRSKNRARSGSTNTDATKSLLDVNPDKQRKSKKSKEKDTGNRISHSPTETAVEPTDGANGHSSAKEVPPPKSNKRMVPGYDSLLQLYIGEWTKAKAERRCRQKTSFALYHRLPSKPVTSFDDIILAIPLYIVYCTSRGEHRHYPIRVRTCLAPDISDKRLACQLRQLTVDIPGENAPYFNTLYALVHYYATYIHLQTGETSDRADIFPWWLEEDDYAEPKTESNLE